MIDKEIENINKLILEILSKKNLNFFLNETIQIVDDSSSSTFKSNELQNDKYFILHHSVTKGESSGVVNILNKRGLGVQWVIDRNGVVHQTLGRGKKGAHVKKIGRKAPKDLSNSTTQGVEIIAMDDSDILLKQCKSALILIKMLGYPLSNIYGHGEVSTNKGYNEGATCKAYVTKYWNTPEEQLPEVDTELSKNTTPKVDEKIPKEVQKQEPKVVNTQIDKEKVPVEKTNQNPPDETKDSSFGEKFVEKLFGNLFSENSDKFKEEITRIKKLNNY
jgi:hypothetical protein